MKMAQAETNPSEVAPRPSKADSEKIARAREAMRQKMEEMNAQQPAATPPPAPEPVPAPVAKSKPAKSAKQAAKPVAKSKTDANSGVFAPMPQATSSAPAHNVELQPASPPPAPAPVSAAAPVAQTPMQPKQPKTIATATPAPVPNKPASAPKPVPAPKPMKNEVKAVSAQAFTPMAAPPVPFSNDKQQRLDQLLKQYQADQITPAQYHEQRAKIIAEP
jgi:nicotinate-nucleotide--dimethylbenzimidazole phosphoribosyltransferase